MEERFGDEHGAFYFTDKEARDLIVRQKVASDSPLPSGNAVAAMRSWLPLSPWRVRWWVWRQLVLLIIVSAAAAWTIGSRI